jgi:hypothetical protein
VQRLCVNTSVQCVLYILLLSNRVYSLSCQLCSASAATSALSAISCLMLLSSIGTVYKQVVHCSVHALHLCGTRATAVCGQLEHNIHCSYSNFRLLRAIQHPALHICIQLTTTSNVKAIAIDTTRSCRYYTSSIVFVFSCTVCCGQCRLLRILDSVFGYCVLLMPFEALLLKWLPSTGSMFELA